MAISTRMSRRPVTPSAPSPSTGVRPSSSRPSSVKNSMAASRSSTTMPTLSIRLTVMMAPWRLTSRITCGAKRRQVHPVVRRRSPLRISCGACRVANELWIHRESLTTLFPYSNKPYDRRLLPAPFPVGVADGVLIIEDPQAIECSGKFVTAVTDVPPLQALPIEISMEPLNHNDSPGLQRVDDLRRVARDHCVHVHPHPQAPTLPAVVKAVDIVDHGLDLHAF